MAKDGDDSGFPMTESGESERGLSKREYMAVQILSGLAANKETWSDRELASQAVSLAEALIEALQGGNEA